MSQLFKMCFQSLPHRLHQHLSGGVLCPGFGVCVWAWWPSGGPSCVCRLCCHLLRMDCWAEACGTSLYLQEGNRTTDQLVNKDMREPYLDIGADSVIRKGRGYQSNAKTWLKTKAFIRRKAFRPVKVCKYKISPNYYS